MYKLSINAVFRVSKCCLEGTLGQLKSSDVKSGMVKSGHVKSGPKNCLVPNLVIKILFVQKKIFKPEVLTIESIVRMEIIVTRTNVACANVSVTAVPRSYFCELSLCAKFHTNSTFLRHFS